ncbi:hypothetical protein [Moraxella lacunata]|uniref:hypothetical protein n=1 Tax=Moraxella lacunata TaxID=477 RepID=UPI0011C07672|nr:hypothetical protein [Moraxella lacunata]
MQSKVVSPSTANDSIGYSGQIRLTKQLANTPQATISTYIAHTTDPDITQAIQRFRRLCERTTTWHSHPFTHIPNAENADNTTATKPHYWGRTGVPS